MQAHVAVFMTGHDEVRVTRLSGLAPRKMRLSAKVDKYRVIARSMTIHVRDAHDLVRLATSGFLSGTTKRMIVRIDHLPAWVTAAGPIRTRLTGRYVHWKRRGDRLTLTLEWGMRYAIHKALRDVLAAVVRIRTWPQTSGPVTALTREAWLDGTSTWPQGFLVDEAPEPETDDLGRPLGTYLPVSASRPIYPPVIGAVGNTYGRSLIGAAEQYRIPDGETIHGASGPLRLDRVGELCNAITKYGVVTVQKIPTAPAAIDGLRALGACGVVTASPDPAVRARLEAFGLVAVADPTQVTDIHGYSLSVAAARKMAIVGDAALSRTALNGANEIALPTVSVLLSSVRSEHIETCLGYLAAQTYPAMEVLVGLHGYEVDPSTLDKWRELLPFPLRILPADEAVPFGNVLGRLTTAADGELVTKVDDDDHYGPHHITDLVIGYNSIGAELVAKGSRFVHFVEKDLTIDRRWAATEAFNVTIAGGTMLMPRSVVSEVGGWSQSSRHVDTELYERLRDNGILVYRIHGLEYTYERRSSGHTWQADHAKLMEQAEAEYPGLPNELMETDW